MRCAAELVAVLGVEETVTIRIQHVPPATTQLETTMLSSPTELTKLNEQLIDLLPYLDYLSAITYSLSSSITGSYASVGKRNSCEFTIKVSYTIFKKKEIKSTSLR